MDPIKILIVEDDETSANMLQKILEHYNYSVIGIVETGEASIEWVRNKKPDLILMDITLKGGMNGIEAAEVITREKKIPFVYITGGIDDKSFERAKKSMPYGYILKPYNKNLIHSAIEMGLYKFDVEKRLHASERRNLQIMNSVPDIIINLTPQGAFVDKIDKDMGKRVWPDAMAKKARPYIKKVIEGGTIEIFDYALQTPDGKKCYEARLIHSSEGSVLAIIRDVTGKKHTQEELDEYKANLEKMVNERTAELTKTNELLSKEILLREQVEDEIMTFGYTIDQSPNGIVITNKDGIVEYTNRKFMEITGFKASELIGQNVTETGNPILSEPELWAKIVSRSQWEGELYNISKDGSVHYFDARISSLKNDKKEVMKYVIVSEDITEKKRELQEIEKVTEMINKSEVDQIGREKDWQEWKEQMLTRNINRTDKSLFRNINNSFTQGAGFGSLISLFDMMDTSARTAAGQVTVDEQIYGLIHNNVQIAQDAFKLFSNIDWVISNEFELEEVSFVDLYHFIKAVIHKVHEFSAHKNQQLIISDLPKGYKDVKISMNREFLYKAIYEGFINALRYSKEGTAIVVMLYKVGINVKIAIINDPERGDGGILGIPGEYSKVVFEPFYRLSKLVFEKYKTLDFGLGLTLIEKIISKHGGEVTLENILDHSDVKREPQVRVNLTFSLPVLN